MAVTDADVQMLWLSTINTSGDVLHMNESCHTCEWVISLHHTATHTATLCNSACAMGGCTRTLALDCCALQYTATLTATHRITLQHSLHHTATRCNTLQHSLQHTATHCNTLQHTATLIASHCNILQHTATHCNTQCNTLQQCWCYGWLCSHSDSRLLRTATHCITLHHTATLTATHCNSADAMGGCARTLALDCCGVFPVSSSVGVKSTV